MSEALTRATERQDDEIVMKLAQDPYVMHVVGHLERGVDIDHEVEDWKTEMVDHLQEKYDVGLNEALDGIIQCHVDFLRADGAESGADQA